MVVFAREGDGGLHVKIQMGVLVHFLGLKSGHIMFFFLGGGGGVSKTGATFLG